MVFGDSSLPSPQSGSLLIKVIIHCSNNLSVDLLICHVLSRMSLGSVTNFGEPARSHAARGELTPLGEFSGKALAAASTFVLRIFPSKFPEVAQAAPVLGNWSKELTFGS